jgi:type IV secretion system protein VirB6
MDAAPAGEHGVSPVCTPPEAPAGVAVLIAEYLDCQSRVLGENGFQALAVGAVGASLLSGLLTIFVALIGYRFILGEAPGLRQGVGWTVRLGLVLALVTGWPAFQALVYDVAVDGPREVARVVLPASGLPSEDLNGRMQRAYDTIRLGSTDPQAVTAAAGDPEGAGAAQRYQFQPPLPRTASLFVLGTAGFEGALRVGVGFLLAIAPLAIMCLLFDGTLGIFSGWVRALGGLTLATLAATIVTALCLVLVEGELGRLQALRLGGSIEPIDPQALSVIVILFAVIMLVTVGAAMRTMSAFRLPLSASYRPSDAHAVRGQPIQYRGPAVEPAPLAVTARAVAPMETRVSSVAESLSSSVRREQLHAGGHGRFGSAVDGSSAPNPTLEINVSPRGAPRRGLGRRTRTSAMRDRQSR